MSNRLRILLFLAVGFAIGLSAYWHLFTTYMAYDDEGYVLISLQNYAAHGGLYAQVYSQYGPFFYLLHDGLHRVFGYEFTNTSGRMIALICWMLSIGFSGHLVWKTTRSVTLALFTIGSLFCYLSLMANEPIHPGGMIAALVAFMAWLGPVLIERQRPTALAIACGIAGAALLLTKINVGIFFLLSSAAWFVMQLGDSRWARGGTLLVAGVIIVLPVALMHAHLDQEWARIFAGLSVIASGTVLTNAWRNREPDLRCAGVAPGIFAFGAVAALTVIIVCARGTSLRELWEGVLIAPLRHPAVYFYEPFWKSGTVIVAIFSLAFFGVAMTQRDSVAFGWIITALRLLCALIVGLAAAGCLPFSGQMAVMSFGMSTIWIHGLILAAGRRRCDGVTWVSLLLILQLLHAYPVAGSQIAWGTFLYLPLIGISLHDSIQFATHHTNKRIPSVIAPAFLALAIFSSVKLAMVGRENYMRNSPLGFPGAANVRLPDDFASTLRVMTQNAAAHGDMLFSLPGMFSFNLWTGLPTPNFSNATHWFSLLSARRQEEIVSQLAACPRPVVICYRGLIDYFTQNRVSFEGPLNRYLQLNFERAFTLKGYEFWIQKGRRIIPLATAELLTLKESTPGMIADKLEIIAAIPPGSQVEKIELASLYGDHRILASWDKHVCSLYSTAIDLEGRAVAAEKSFQWGQPLPALVRLDVPVDKTVLVHRPTSVVYLIDATGDRIGEARFVE